MGKLSILIIGGTGFIGSTLSHSLLDAGYQITVMSRKPESAIFLPGGITMLQGDTSKPGTWQEKVSGFDIVINLSGASIFRRWTARGKQEILQSRILTTKNIVDALINKRNRVRQFYNVSGAGIYGFHHDEVLDETGSFGSDFIAQVAAEWEDTALKVKELGIRLVICRLGHVLGMQGGALPKLVTLARFHLAGYWGKGDQWISWVHHQDIARAVIFLLNNQVISGPVNISSPFPVRNREMMRMLAKKTGKRALIPNIPEFALRLLLGEFSSVFVNGQKVVPAVLQQNGFCFQYPRLEEALNDLLNTRL
jgi:uncharacterized protein (TIGR01777 family)